MSILNYLYQDDKHKKISKYQSLTLSATVRKPAYAEGNRPAARFWLGSGTAWPGHRPARHQHDPHALDRRRPEGELGAPGDADVDGAGRLRALAEPPALRPGRPDLAQPRPLRALGRPRLDAALLDALPRRGEAGRRRLQVTDEPACSLHEIENFRQLHSRTPGHPEYRWTTGVETTTGPLGQGIATSVGMAIASKWQGERFGADLFDFNVYALAGDGCLMEGVSHESASLAGHLKLDNLCWLYDNNHITIDGATSLAYGDDVLSRFEGYGWNVLRVGDANDAALLSRAFDEFKAETGRPTLIVVDSHIGWGSPNKQDTESAHGEPLGEEEVKLTKQAYGWPEDAQFLVPDGVRERFDEVIGARGAEESAAWKQKLAASEHAGRRSR